ncbi:MAG: hydrogenase subunit MbhD domain-containing protein [Eubacteriales bacterium]
MTILDIVSIAVGILMMVLGVLALNAKKIFNSVIYLSLLSMLAVVCFVIMRAPDVAITEAVIGSGLVTALFIFTIFAKGKESDEA